MLLNDDNIKSYRENNRLEIKKATGGLPNSLWETYSAFANSSGGLIVLGIEEKNNGEWKITGVENAAKMQKEFWDTINNSNKVSCNILMDTDVEIQNINGCDVIFIHVPEAHRSSKPVYIKNNIFSGSYRRNWEGDYHCTPAEVRGMLRDVPEETADMKIVEDLFMDSLCKETIKSYRNRHISFHHEHVWESLSDCDYLERIGAAKYARSDGKLHPTVAGLLMFGYEYRILYEFPEYFLDYRNIIGTENRWSDRVHSGSGDWSGNFFDFFFRIFDKLTSNLDKPFYLDGIVRNDNTDIHRAIREAVVNCLANADFSFSRGVVIVKREGEITIENPGSIRVDINQMLKGGISDPRNKAIMKMFNLIGIGERAGSGVPDIVSVWNKHGLGEISIKELYAPDRTIMSLPFKQAIKTSDKEKQAIKASDKEKQAIKASDKETQQRKIVLEFLERQGEGASSDIAAKLGLSMARTRVLLKRYVNEGIIGMKGEKKGRRYYLV